MAPSTKKQAQVKKLSESNRSLKAQITDKDAIISQLEACVSELEDKAEATLSDQLTKKHKRVKQLERDLDTKQQVTLMELSTLEDGLDDKLGEIRQLNLDLAACWTELQSRDATIRDLQSMLWGKQAALTVVRKDLHKTWRWEEHAKGSLQSVKQEYRRLHTWNVANILLNYGNLCTALPMPGVQWGRWSLQSEPVHRHSVLKYGITDSWTGELSDVINEREKYGEIQLGIC
ncbi:hypothetical protein K438DRAFT_1756984 [Mycena galopus ATCC 62051]|nr:hypothetical protein K438DRAFT_1756984 [Mycena galopus ATCC 62051]